MVVSAAPLLPLPPHNPNVAARVDAESASDRASKGVAVATAEGVEPVPALLMAEMRNQYWPMVRFVRVLVVSVLVVSATATEKPAEAEVVLCSILYPVMAPPPVAALLVGAVHARVTSPTPDVADGAQSAHVGTTTIVVPAGAGRVNVAALAPLATCIPPS